MKYLLKKIKKQQHKKKIFPSGIVQIITRNEKNQLINSQLDYNDLKENYIKNMKDNADKELIQFI